MNDLKGGVRAPRTVEQRQSAKRNPRLPTDQFRKYLPARQRASRNERKRIEFGLLVEFNDLAFEMQLRGVVDYDDMFEASVFRERQGRRSMSLHRPASAEVRFDERRPGAGAERDLDPGIKRIRALAARDMDDLNRLADFRAARHLDGATAEAHRLDERDNRVIDARRARLSADDGGADGQAVAELRDEASIEHHQPRDSDLLSRGQDFASVLDRGSVRGGRQRRCVDHRGAQIGIVPGFDAPRRAGPGQRSA